MLYVINDIVYESVKNEIIKNNPKIKILMFFLFCLKIGFIIDKTKQGKNSKNPNNPQPDDDSERVLFNSLTESV